MKNEDHYQAMLLGFPGDNNTKLGITCDEDNNIATDLQCQFTFESYGLPPYRQYPPGEISVPAYYRLRIINVSLTSSAQAHKFPRTVKMYDDDPSQLHTMIKDFEIRMYDENPMLARLFPVSNHTIACAPQLA
jgi:hypothetical protein